MSKANRNIKIYLFRHGQTEWNEKGLAQGKTDIPLDATGLAQAQELAKQLKGHGIEAIFSSDLKRARQTAETVAEQLGLRVYTTKALQEVHLGDAEGLHSTVIREKFADILSIIHDPAHPRRHHTRIPNGETRQEVFKRINSYIMAKVRSKKYKCFAISAHGGVLATFLMRYFGEYLPFANCEYRIIEYNPRTKKFTWTASPCSKMPLGDTAKTI